MGSICPPSPLVEIGLRYVFENSGATGHPCGYIPASGPDSCFYISTERAHDPRELCKYSYDCQAKGESGSHGSHLNPNARTNKQTTSLLQNKSLPMVMQGELQQTYSPMLRHFMGSSLAGLYPSLQIHLPTLIVVLRKQSLLAPRQSSSFKQST